MTADDPSPRHRLYGRAQGKPLSKRQQALVDELLPRIAVPETAQGQLDPLGLFKTAPAALNAGLRRNEQDAQAFKPREVWLEIGFGGGEHLAGQAARHGDVGFIGAEPFIDGVAKLLTQIHERGLANVRIRRGDARDLVAQLAPASIARAYILFPDPWPKTRHRKRRLIQPAFLDDLSRVLAQGARVRFATDWADYGTRALADFTRDGRYRWTAECADDWRTPPADHVTTRYQEKRLGDCAPVFLDFVFDA